MRFMKEGCDNLGRFVYGSDSSLACRSKKEVVIFVKDVIQGFGHLGKRSREVTIIDEKL